MLCRVGSILITLFVLFSTVQLSGQSTYTLRNLVSPGNRAPVPPRLSGILEYSFNDKVTSRFQAGTDTTWRSQVWPDRTRAWLQM
jgi:hypothetical protein